MMQAEGMELTNEKRGHGNWIVMGVGLREKKDTARSTRMHYIGYTGPG
jgi:hypothetical protein